jgi:lipoprotein-anchoring transpeptidase ErfK/SrfK
VTRTGRSARRVRVGSVVVTLLLAASLTASVAAAPATPMRVAVVEPRQELAMLAAPQEAHSGPSEHSAREGMVPARRPITDGRTVLPVLGHKTSGDGLEWLQVLLPGRPNGHSGWIGRRGTISINTYWHIVVDTSARRVIVYERGRQVRAFKAIVGKPSTPTPLGEFFVEEGIQLSPNDVGAPFALALSARSDVLQEFDGGPGQIAFHGLANVGGLPGTAVSHGCIRLDTAAIRWLIARIGPGTPVTITD